MHKRYFEVKVRPDGWQARVQRYTMGRDFLQLKSFCPFFWVTVSALLLLPEVALGRGLWWLARISGAAFISMHVDQRVGAWCDRRAAKALRRKLEKTPAPDLGYVLYHELYGWGSGVKRRARERELDDIVLALLETVALGTSHTLLTDAFNKWRAATPDWRDVLAARERDAYERAEAKRVAEDARLLREHERQKRARALRDRLIAPYAAFVRRYAGVLRWLPTGVITV